MVDRVRALLTFEDREAPVVAPVTKPSKASAPASLLDGPEVIPTLEFALIHYLANLTQQNV